MTEDRAGADVRCKMRVGRSAGYEVVEDEEPHGLVLLPHMPTDSADPMWDHLLALFSDVQPNPRREIQGD